MRPLLAPILLWICVLSCGYKTPTGVPDPCQSASLPIFGAQGAPTVKDVALEAQTDGVVVLATATDPEGTDNMLHVVQTIGVFPDFECKGPPILVQDDLACSDCEESFGIAVPTSNQSLYNQISGATGWPVTVEFSDIDGHKTSGRVLARIVH
ncbi:MAG: hypothetical protein ACJ8BF_03720 [Gemmatimonadales bacterium]